jgi:shikimate dehydrogenase
MTSSVRRACIMGHPVAHSRSPMIHNYWLKQLGIAGSYDFMDLAPEQFADFVTHMAERGYVGGNVTVPHKEAAFRLAEQRDAAAETVGAVNVLWLENGRLMGGNSDVHGFVANLDDRAPGWDVKGGLAVILGAGGAARGAVYGLMQRGMRVALVNRTPARAAELAAHYGGGTTAHGWDDLPGLLAQADLLVNCTSLGMVGKDPLVIDLAPLKAGAVVYDIVYVPLETALLAEAKRRGHRTVDGLGMLLQQAGYGFQKWFGAQPRVTAELRSICEADIVAKTPRA